MGLGEYRITWVLDFEDNRTVSEHDLMGLEEYRIFEMQNFEEWDFLG